MTCAASLKLPAASSLPGVPVPSGQPSSDAVAAGCHAYSGQSEHESAAMPQNGNPVVSGMEGVTGEAGERHALSPTRPLLRWHGGKWKLAPWIISHFPQHRVYVEPFGGAGSVLMRKPRSYAEVWNDLDGDVVNLFRVLRSQDAGRLVDLLRLTPFARDEFAEAYGRVDDPVERARRLVIRSFMGFGSNGHSRVTGFRSNSNRSGTTPAHDWANYPEALAIIIDRLTGVVVENRDAREVMLAHDAPTTLHYVDPPYLMATRADPSKDYAHEMTDGDHADLLAFLRKLSGMVVLSGYPSAMYDAALSDWRRIERKALADGAAPRTEVLWINPVAAISLEAAAANLFVGLA